MRHLPLVVFLACLSHRCDASRSSSSSRSAPPWQQDQSSTSPSLSLSALSTASSVREAAFYSELPPTVFNPSGRLVSLESAVQKLSDPLDPSGSLVVAIHCHEGMAVVASIPQSPYLYDPAVSAASPNKSASAASNYTSDESHSTTAANISTSEGTVASTDRRGNEDRPLLEVFQAPTRDAGAASDEISSMGPIYPPPLPFCVMGPALLGAVGGSAPDGLVLRSRLQRMAHELREDGEEMGGGYVARTLARRLADAFHARTLREASDRDGNAQRILACGAMLCDQRELWRVDPSGQFYRCRAAVAGRASSIAEAVLVEALLDRRKKAIGVDDSNMEEDAAAAKVETVVEGYHGRHIRQDLFDLTLREALAIAAQTVRNTLRKAKPSSIRRGGEAGSEGATRTLGMTIPVDSSATEWHDEDHLADIVRKLEELEE